MSPVLRTAKALRSLRQNYAPQIRRWSMLPRSAKKCLDDWRASPSHSSLSPLFRPPAHSVCTCVVTMSFARTFLRTSRALRTPTSNPIQCALSSRGSQQLVNTARCYATVFERNKPHVNIGTIGHVDHGKVHLYIRRMRCGLCRTDNGYSRQLSQQPSPNGKQRKGTPPTSNTAPSTKRRKNASAGSPLAPPTSNTRPTTDTTPTSTARATPITSRT